MKKINKNKKLIKRILVVEDDEATLESAAIKFKKTGFEVATAENGREGIEKLRKEGPFMGVLLDLHMPNGDGFSFLEEKSKDQIVKDIPVIVFTNFGQPEFVTRAMDLGAISYLVKASHSIDDIVNKVKKCLEEKECQADKI